MILKYFDYIKDVNDIDYNVMGFFLILRRFINGQKSGKIKWFIIFYDYN